MALASTIETNSGAISPTGIIVGLSPSSDPNVPLELWRTGDSAGAPDVANALMIFSGVVPPSGFNFFDQMAKTAATFWYRCRTNGAAYGPGPYTDWINLGAPDRVSLDALNALLAGDSSQRSAAWDQQNARIGPQGNLLPNPGFEDGEAFWLFDTGVATIVTSSANANSGNKYLQLTSTTGVAAAVRACDDVGKSRYFEVNTNDVVQWGGYAYRVSGTANVRYVLELTDKDKLNPTLFNTSNQNTAAWLQVQAQTIVGAGKKYARYWAEIDATGTGVVARFDDAYMRIALGAIYDTPPPNSLYEIRFANAVPDPDGVDGLQTYIDFPALTNFMRVGQTPKAISGSTAVNPSVVNVTAHGYTSNDVVTIRGHLTNTAINGTWSITVIDVDHFSVPVLGNGTGGTTGHVVKLRLTVKPNGDLALYGGILTAGKVQDRNAKFVVDLDQALITVTDEQPAPKVRAKLGKVVAASAELVANGGGETGSVGAQAPSWTFDSGNALNIANDFVNSGSQSMKIVNTVAADSYSHQDFSVTAGRIYKLSGWIKTTALPTADTGWGALVNIDGQSGITGFISVSKITVGDPSSVAGQPASSFNPDVGIAADGATHAYTYIESVFVPLGTSGTIRVYLQLGFSGTQSGTAWFDDISLTALADYGTQLFDHTGATIVDFTAAKRILAVPVQPMVDSGSAVSLDLSTGITQQVRLTASAPTITLLNPVNGARYRIWLQQDTAGSRLFPIIKNATGVEIVMYTADSAPTLTTTPGALDLFEFEYRTDPTARFTCMTLQTNVLLPSPTALSVTPSTNTGVTTHVATMPGTIIAGELLLVFFVNDSSQTPGTPSGGWTLIAQGSWDTGTRTFSIWGKVAAGGDSFSVTTAGAATSAIQVHRITRWFGALAGVTFSGLTTGSSTTPDPPSLTPSWTVDRNLWIAAAGASVQPGVTGTPANYANTNTTSPGGSTCILTTARRQLYATVENPGTFTISPTEPWGTFTVAVQPPA